MLRLSWERFVHLKVKDNFWIATILITSIMIRVYHFLEITTQRIFEHPSFYMIRQNGLESPFYLLITNIFLRFQEGVGTLSLVGLNIILGSLTCVLVYLIGHNVYSRRWFGIVGGVLIAFQPWHIYFSLTIIPEILSGFLISLLTLLMITKRIKSFIFISLLVIGSTIILWSLVIAELFVMISLFSWSKSEKLKILALPLGGMITAALLLFYSFFSQKLLPHMVFYMRDLIGGIFFYFSSLFLMTFALFFFRTCFCFFEKQVKLHYSWINTYLCSIS